jgi:NADPH2:quinone reductase
VARPTTLIGAVRAIQIESHGGPETMHLVERPDPSPAPGEVLIEVEAAGVNFIDVYQRSGAYPAAKLPAPLGLEGAGRVRAAGAGAEALLHKRVAWASVPGSYATLVVAPRDKVVEIPDGIDSDTAAAAMLQGMTAHYLARSTYVLGRDDRCLIHAAAGGVGRLLAGFARAAGAISYGTVSTEAKARIAKEAGLSEAILYTKQDFEAEVRRLSGGAGVSVVYDSVGRDTFIKGMSCLRPRGMMVLYGQSSGKVEPFDPQILNTKGSLFLARPSLFHYTATRAELEMRAREVFQAIRDGVISIAVHKTYPLSNVAEAHRDLESRKTSGKLLLNPAG